MALSRDEVPPAESEVVKANKCLKREDYDEALAHYVSALRIDGSSVESSDVIRKLLEVAQIRNLAIFLEELHNVGLATAESSDLWLSCLAQLKASSGKVRDAMQTAVVSGSTVSDVIEQRLGADVDAKSEIALNTLRSHASTTLLGTEVGQNTASIASPIVELRSRAQTGDANFLSVKDYVAEALIDQARHLTVTQKQVHRLKRDVLKARTRLQELRRTSHIFQSSHCFRCSQTLELPAVYFFCMHNYHQGCTEGVCDKCF